MNTLTDFTLISTFLIALSPSSGHGDPAVDVRSMAKVAYAMRGGKVIYEGK